MTGVIGAKNALTRRRTTVKPWPSSSDNPACGPKNERLDQPFDHRLLCSRTHAVTAACPIHANTSKRASRRAPWHLSPMLRSVLGALNPAFDNHWSNLPGERSGSPAINSSSSASSRTRTAKYTTSPHPISGTHLKQLIARIANTCEAHTSTPTARNNAAVARQSNTASSFKESCVGCKSDEGLDTIERLLSHHNAWPHLPHDCNRLLSGVSMSCRDQPRRGYRCASRIS
jgi:hypothetical protein